MKLLITLLLAISLLGCAAWKPEKIEPLVVVQHEYILRIPPAEVMLLPPEVPQLDVDKAEQGDVAKWLYLYKDRMLALEGKLREVAKFLVDEQSKLDSKKPIK